MDDNQTGRGASRDIRDAGGGGKLPSNVKHTRREKNHTEAVNADYVLQQITKLVLHGITIDDLKKVLAKLKTFEGKITQPSLDTASEELEKMRKKVKTKNANVKDEAADKETGSNAEKSKKPTKNKNRQEPKTRV